MTPFLPLLLLVVSPLALSAQDRLTPLAQLAAKLQPGAWAELKTTGYTRELLGGHDILIYSDRATWDPKTQQVLFIGQDHLRPPPRFISYDASKNAWAARPTPDWAKPLKWFHAYENNAIDQAGGRFFHHPSASRIVHQYDIAKDTWTTLPEIRDAATGHGTALEYFPERKCLVRVLNGVLHTLDDGAKAWVRYPQPFKMGPYHNVAIYSPPHKYIIFGGGNGSSDLYRLSADGKVTALKPAPVGVGIGQSVTTVDPVTGELLVLHKSGSFHACDPVQNQWRELAKEKVPFDLKGSSHRIVAVPLVDHGVVLFFTSPGQGMKVWLYRHSAPRKETQPWGTIKGRIVWGEKEVPRPAPIQLNGLDTAYFHKRGPILDETWVVDPKTKGLRDVMIWLEPAQGELPVHPDLIKVDRPTVLLEMVHGQFKPRVLGLREGQTLTLHNQDEVAHNVTINGNPRRFPGSSLVLPPRGKASVQHLKSDRDSLPVTSLIHPWMRGYLRVFNHPYFAVTGPDGTFELRQAPAGEWRLKIWHPRGGWLGGAGGRKDQMIRIAGDRVTDLGMIAIPPSAE